MPHLSPLVDEGAAAVQAVVLLRLLDIGGHQALEEAIQSSEQSGLGQVQHVGMINRSSRGVGTGVVAAAADEHSAAIICSRSDGGSSMVVSEVDGRRVYPEHPFDASLPVDSLEWHTEAADEPLLHPQRAFSFQET